MKKNYKNISLLLMSVMLACTANSGFAIEQDPTFISDDKTVNTGINNVSQTEYFPASGSITSINVGGGIYQVQDTGSLTIGTTGSVVFNNIAAMVNPGTPDYDIGRQGGVIYNIGDLYIGAQLNGSSISETGQTVTFSNNLAGQGGAINNTGTAYIYNAVFENNTANLYTAQGSSSSYGGWDTANTGRGGAICNLGSANIASTGIVEGSGQLTISNTAFRNNTAETFGGAIYNGDGGVLNINNNSTFEGNHADNNGGAIYNSTTDSSLQSAVINIDNATFTANQAALNGGAILNQSEYVRANPDADTERGSYVYVNNTTFTNNTAYDADLTVGGTGGAISNNTTDYSTRTAIVSIQNTEFNNNGYKADGTMVTGDGGAVNNEGELVINSSSFTGNAASGHGGAIQNSGKAEISNTTFTGNGTFTVGSNTDTVTSGGAIYNWKNDTNAAPELIITNATFESNKAVSNGGALYNAADATVIDSDFNNNSAANGGAVYGAVNSNTTVIAQNKDVNFRTASDTIYLSAGSTGGSSGSTDGAVLNLNANAGRSINLNGAVTAPNAADDALVPVVNVNYDVSGTDYNGNVNFNGGVKSVNMVVHNGMATANSQVSNSTVTTQGGTMKFTKDEYLGTSASKNEPGVLLNNLVLNGGTVDIQNGVVSNIALDSFTLQNTTNMKVDVDVVNEQMDNLLQSNIGDGAGSGINITNGNLNISDMNLVNEGEKESANILFTDINGLTVDNVTTDVTTLEGQIYKYNVNKVSGSQLGLDGDAADDVYFSFQNTGGPSDNVTTGPVAQVGAFILMDNIYRQSFANMDMLSILTRDERENLKNYNRYANMFEDEINTFYRDKRQEDYPSVFVRGFTNFEKVPLKRGPHVDSIFYGTLIGHESGLYELGKGWDANYAVFGAYTGAYQHYNGINQFLNGGAAGGVFTAYKGDFWTGITANAGGWAVDANNDFGSEHFPMMGAGVAAKAGYNWRLFDNKFIIQPSYMMSYTFIYSYSHNNAAGVHIKQDPLHAIEIIPGVKLIANNFKNGWQPYLAVNMTWVCMDGARFWANDVAFNNLSIRPFVEYGIGIQKHHGEHATGYLQAMVRNGGRNGVALTGGFRWAIGEDIID